MVSLFGRAILAEQSVRGDTAELLTAMFDQHRDILIQHLSLTGVFRYFGMRRVLLTLDLTKFYRNKVDLLWIL